MLRSRAVLIAVGVMALVGCLTVVDVGYADPIYPDPIVRVRDDTIYSIGITSLPYYFDFGLFPNDPDGTGTDCYTGTENGLNLVGCHFVNQTGVPISLLNFVFSYDPLYPPFAVETYTTQDPNGWFQSRTITQYAADFSGTGIPALHCFPGGDVNYCSPQHFAIELIGFPDLTNVTVTASSAVPEPATVSLIATGLAALAIRRRRR